MTEILPVVVGAAGRESGWRALGRTRSFELYDCFGALSVGLRLGFRALGL